MDAFIAINKIEYQVKDDIPSETIRKRIQRSHLDPSHPGTKSPIWEAEKTLVVISVAMGKFRQPLNCAEGVCLMNDIIKGTHLQDAVKDFQSNRKLNVGDTCGTLGPNWWRGFMRRHEYVIVSRRG